MPLSAGERAEISAFLVQRGVEQEDLPAAIRQLEQLAAAQPVAGAEEEDHEPQLSSFDIEGIAEGIRDGRFKKVVMVVGAGISVSAGIPDFRSPGTGLYDNLQRYDLPSPQDIFSIDFFKRKPHAFYHLARELYPGSYAPTPTHYLLRLLHSKGVLLRCFTQNIDSLENLAGLPKDMVVAAHGNFDSAKCIETGQPVPVD
jgi:NAD-dependent deacetylase sirtuin 2